MLNMTSDIGYKQNFAYYRNSYIKKEKVSGKNVSWNSYFVHFHKIFKNLVGFLFWGQFMPLNNENTIV